jgi:hypothetical protein
MWLYFCVQCSFFAVENEQKSPRQTQDIASDGDIGLDSNGQ